jgi:hypothetical protein
LCRPKSFSLPIAAKPPVEIPHFVVQTFSKLPAAAGNLTVPNYIEGFLSGTQFVNDRSKPHEPSLETFLQLLQHGRDSRPPGAPGG